LKFIAKYNFATIREKDYTMNKWNTLLQENDYLGIKKYTKNGANVNKKNDETEESVLAMALRLRCDKDILDLLVELGADIKAIDKEGVSILDNAITYNAVDFALWLLDNGIDVNENQRKSGFTALMGAVCYNRTELIKEFLARGADIKAVDTKGYDVKEFARRMNKKRTLELLTEYEAKQN